MPFGKTIRVKDSTYDLLNDLKTKHNFNTFDEVIVYLLNQYNEYKQLKEISKLKELLELWSKLKVLLKDNEIRDILTKIPW